MSRCIPKNRVFNLPPRPFNEVDNLIEQFFGPQFVCRGDAGWRANASLWETEDRVHLEFDAPGVLREGVDVTYEKGELRVSLDRPASEGRTYRHNERGFGKVTRSVTLPETLDPNSIEAELSDGLLRVSIAKVPEAKPKRIELK